MKEVKIMSEDSKKKILSVTLDGKSMKSRDCLFNEISKKMNFPDYFGRNWNALDDCFQDLAWIEQDEITVTLLNKEYILTEDCSDEIDIFYSCITDAEKYWIEDKTKKVDFFIL